MSTEVIAAMTVAGEGTVVMKQSIVSSMALVVILQHSVVVPG